MQLRLLPFGFCLGATLVICTRCHGQTATSEEIEARIYETASFDSSGRTAGSYRYYIKVSQLSTDAKWIPGATPLPIELKSFLQDAEQYCAKAYQLTNKLRLSNLEVWRLNFPAGFKTNFGKKSPDFENQWFATLRFDQIKGGLAREVVRMLNGSYAREEYLPSQNVADSQWGRERSAHSLERTNTLILGPRNMDRNGRNDYPFAIWEDKNFEVPKVQWDTRSSFPLDLNKEERRAKDRVVNLEPRSGEESMRLEGIAIKRFAPIAAVEAQRLNWLDNDWHWVVHFHYSDIEGKKSAVTSVLLDGRIVR